MANPWAKMTGQDDDEENQQANQQFVDGETGGVDSPGSATAAKAVPTSSKENVIDIRAQLADWLNRQKGGVDKVQQFADQYGKQLDARGGQYNLSPLMQFADSINGTETAKNYKAPPTDAEITAEKMKAQEEVAKTGNPVAQELLKEYSSDTSGNNALARALATKTNKETSTENHLDAMEEKMAKAMNPMSSPYGSGNSNLGTRLARARSAMALIRQHPNLDLDKREMKDFALTTAILLSNQNRVPYELVQDLVPKSFKGGFLGAMELFQNAPKSVEAQEFVKRMMQTIIKEQDTATQEIQAIQKQQADGFNPLLVHRPERHMALTKGGANYLSIPNLDKLPDAALTPPVEGAKLQQNKKGERSWLLPDGTRQKVK